jgi:retron-type reverse transcriptase/sRNA-binding protein
VTARQPTRAELIERIAASSKDAVVLDEMRRFGFWPADTGKPSVEAALIEREVELVKALNGLQAVVRERGDPVAALKAMRKARMAQARERRETTAQAREQKRYERALRWHASRESHAGYLGQGVSGGLQAPADAEAALVRLREGGLPPLATPQALAEAMGLSVPELKFLSFHREVARVTHYRRFALPKKTGGERIISAPMPRLKRAQYWVLDNVLAKVPCHEAAHGFLPGRSIVTNAATHTGQGVVINLDLKDFFPSVAYPRIKGVFAALGYPEAVATVLALLCSENVSDTLEVDGEPFHVGGTARERVLPQGAPTSPMLTNILCRRLDRRLQGLAAKLGFRYTRYADDLTFSASGDGEALVGRLLRQVHHVLKDEGFTPHPDKQHVMRRGARQEVTGVVVNDGPSVSRTQRRALRAALHRAGTAGVGQATWNGTPASRDTLLGQAQFVRMVNATQGGKLVTAARALPVGGEAARPRAADTFRQRSARGEAPLRAEGVWWVPAPRPVPQLQLTAGQIQAQRRAARQARQQAARATEPAPAATETATETATAEGGTPAPTPPQVAVPWVTFGIQAGLMMLVAAPSGSALALLLASGWLGYALLRRKFGWWWYAVALLVLTHLTPG